LTLQGLFGPSCFNDMIDPVADADTQPAVFSPLCGFTGTLVMRGGGCRLDFGWYNANMSGQAPADNEIFTLVPANPTAMDFCPLAGVSTQAQIGNMCTSCPANRGAAVTTFEAGAIRDDMRYLSPDRGGTGLIGFALRGLAGSQCTQTHFSENDLNPDCTTGCTTPGPWIMTLVYTSKTQPDTFYLAFEDLPATNFGPNDGQNDGDFNDFVYQITGVTCEGGGQPCQVEGRTGACANGTTACGPGGTIICSGGLEPTDEQCDNIDNNCDGMVDNDPNLCAVPDNKVCYQGKCVPRCGTGEFQCTGVGETCVDGLCVDIPCMNVTCAAEEVCRGGMCVGACTGVVCPLTVNGRPECRLGRCADPCVSAGCEALGLVCERGSCVRACDCRACPDGTACAPSGQCVDTACATMQCPAGQICFEGQCQDPCNGAMCPGGAMCTAGECGPPGASGTGAGGTGGNINTGGSGLVIAGTSNSGFGGSGGASGGDDCVGEDCPGPEGTPTGNPGCACRITGSRDASAFMTLLAAALAGAFGARRRQRP
jgi:MYXO-CTERM domain-containing protein